MGALPPGWALPELTPENRAWFTSGEVAVQCCAGCGALQHPPEEVCHRCGASVFGTRTLAPRGTVHSHTVVHYAATAGLATAVPYTVVLVALDDAPGIRVLADLVGGGPVSIGMPVEATWDEHPVDDGDVIRLLHWRPSP